MAASYTTLDPSSSDNGKSVAIDGNFSSITSSLVLVCVTFGVLAAISFRFVPALIGFMSGDGPAQHSKAKENLWAGVFGLAVILLLIPFATSINSTIGKLQFKSTGVIGGIPGVPVLPIVTPVVSGSGGNKTCEATSIVKDKMSTSGGVCSNKSCSAKCSFSAEVLTAIKTEASAKGVDYRYVAAIACRESGGNPNAKGALANNGKPDCGLMQINSTSCGADIMNLKNNIDAGIDLFKSKLNSVPSSYPNIARETQAFAAYNCCSNGDNPNAQSNDCTVSAGFTFTLPKWACPINPGTGNFNMCAVKDYACDITSCASSY